MDRDCNGDIAAVYDCECCPECHFVPCSGSTGSEFWCERQRCTCDDPPDDDDDEEETHNEDL